VLVNDTSRWSVANCFIQLLSILKPFHPVAVAKGNREMLRILLDSPSGNPHVVTNINESLLYLAVKGGYNEVAQDLLEKGVSPIVATKAGDTPLHLVRDSKDKLCVLRVYLCFCVALF
jgi:hypothetical protein